MPPPRIRSLSPLLLATMLAAACGERGAPPERTVVLRHANVVDVATGAVHPNTRVTIVGRHISSLTPDTAPPPADTTTPAHETHLDATGKFLIPGLWDMHVHIDTTERWFFPLAIAAGVTGVRDMGGSLDRIAKWKTQPTDADFAPRIVAAGPIVIGDVADDDSRVVRLATPAAATAIVDSLVSGGADFIKVHDWLSPDAYRALAAAARQRQTYLAGHLPILLDPLDAIDAGQRSIEHMGNGWHTLLLWTTHETALIDSLRAWARVSSGPPELARHFTPAWMDRVAAAFDPIQARALARSLAQSGVWLTPTTWASAYLQLMPLDSGIVRDERLAYLPPDIRALTSAVLPPERFRTPARETPAMRFYARRAQLVRLAADDGVGILAGTDVGPHGPTIPGFSLHDELQRLVADGLTPLEALRAATLSPANFLDVADSLGSVANGKIADLVLLDGDPLADIANVARVHAVVVGGRLLSAAARRELLEGMKR